jgi:polyisoprenoid-binding protein YceI
MILVAVLVLMSAVSVQAEVWKVDPAHSSIKFEVRHMVISRVHGIFGQFDGTMSFDDSSFNSSKVNFIVQTASVDTDNADRDKHLKSADFFDVVAHPTMTFKSTAVRKGSGDSFELEGELTIHSVTKTVVFVCDYYGSVVDPWGNTKSGFSASTTINRQDFGITWSKSLDSGGLVVGDDVTIVLDLEFAIAG